MTTLLRCQNGYPVLAPEETRLWVIPGAGTQLRLARGPVGFILAVHALWFHERVERLDDGPTDDWGYAVRLIEGSTDYSNHGHAAEDLNATRHPMGVPTARTFTPTQVARIHRRLRLYGGVMVWGGDYRSRPDGMHFELVGSRAAVRALAATLRLTKLGRRVRRANIDPPRGS